MTAAKVPVARGYKLPDGKLQFSMKIDDVTYREIAERAEKAGWSFTTEVLSLIEIGLETMKAEDEGE